MFDHLRWSRVKHGEAPESLVYAGTQRTFSPFLLHYAYGDEDFIESRLDAGTPFSPIEDRINLLIVVGVHLPEVVKAVGASLNLSLLSLEDVMNTGQRPKFEWADDDTGFIVMKHMDVKEETLESEQVSLFWRQGLVVVFLEKESDLLGGLIQRIKMGKGRIRSSNSSYLLAAILDGLVDHQMLALTQISDSAQKLEGQLGQEVTNKFLGKIYELKRELILFRNMLLPVREIFISLLKEDAEIPETVLPYLRDIAGHHEQVVDGVTALHDILTSMIDYQISLIGIRTNKIMQFLTVIATIFIPLTFISGVYGMNFAYMPELHWKYGYFVALGVMGAIAVAMLVYFFRKRFF